MKPINPDKERIIILVNQLLARSGLNIDQVVARMQIDGCSLTRNTFENRFTTRVHQKPTIPEEWLAALIRAFRSNLAEHEKCTAAEALELCRLARLPLDQIGRLKDQFTTAEFADAAKAILGVSYFSIKPNTIKPDNSLANPVRYSSTSTSKVVEIRTFEWGEAPDPTYAHGRDKELRIMAEWITQDSSRLIGIFGMGGIGKSLLAAQLSAKVQPHFDRVLWYSLRNAPTLSILLGDCLLFLLGIDEKMLPESTDKRSDLLLRKLRQARVLLILDGYEVLIETGDNSGTYRVGYENYTSWLRRYTETTHSSCMILTSREKPLDFISHSEILGTTRSLVLGGLGLPTVRTMLKERGLNGSEHQWHQFHERYSGNPLALQLAAEPIVALFNGSIGAFLENNASLFQDIRELLEEQFGRLALLEREILYWLVIERAATTIEVLHENIGESVPRLHLLEALHSLLRRSLIEQTGNTFWVSQIIQTYLTERLIELVVHEIEAGVPLMLTSFALLKTESKEHLRDTQMGAVIFPILERLLRFSNRNLVEEKMLAMLVTLQQRASFQGNYGAGNLLNLLGQLNADLRGRDFSGLEIRAADLRTTNLQDVNFSNAIFHTSRFWENFASISALAYSQDGQFIAAGMTNGEIHLWLLKHEELRYRLLGHADMIWAVAFSPDSTLLATACEDHTVRIWEVASGECRHELTAHRDWVKSLCFIGDGAQIATTGHDATIRIWDVQRGQCLQQWDDTHANWIWSVASSPDARLLATASQDHTVKIWDRQSGRCLHQLVGHTEPVRTVAFSPDGQQLLSASFDHTIRLWHVSTGELDKILQGHENLIWSAAYSPDGQRIVSGGDDPQIFLWDVETGTIVCTLSGHQNRLWALAFHPDGKMIASGGDDQRLRFWSAENGQPLRHLAGYANQIWALAVHPSQRFFASGGDDGTIRLWEHATGTARHFLQGHTERVRCIAFSHDGGTVASGGDDHTVRIWDVHRNVALHTLHGHQNRVWSVAYTANPKRLVSCSEDQTIRLWNVDGGRLIRTLYTEGGRIWSIDCHPTQNLLVSSGDQKEILLWNLDSGQCIGVWEGHQARVWQVTFSRDGTRLASGGADHAVFIWESATGAIQHQLVGHQNAVWSVAFSPDGQWLASSGDDQYICLWEVATGKRITILYGHQGCVWSLSFITNTLLASAGQDESVHLWDVEKKTLLTTLHSERPYERMNIAGIQGLTEAQKASLCTLGALEQ